MLCVKNINMFYINKYYLLFIIFVFKVVYFKSKIKYTQIRKIILTEFNATILKQKIVLLFQNWEIL